MGPHSLSGYAGQSQLEERFTMHRASLALAAFAGLGISGSAFAGILTWSGQLQLVGDTETPISFEYGQMASNEHMALYIESVGHTLDDGLMADIPGEADTYTRFNRPAQPFEIEAGTFIDSFFIHQDLVGNNPPVFFIRDTMKFPHFIRSQKRRGANGLRDNDMQWDFWTLNPESAHQVTWLMGDRGIPRTWRHMNGYGSHTYMLYNEAGEKTWVKFHFIADQGVECLTQDEANRVAGEDSDHHRRDLFEAIEAGDHPSWTLKVQLMPYEDAKTYRINPFDLTKVWPHADYPLVEVGKMTLDRNPANHFAQIEQAAFEPSAIVPGIGFSPDNMLLGRVFAYADTHRHRLGANYQQLPVNRHKVEGAYTYQFDGPMAYDHTGDRPKYAPNSYDAPSSDLTGPVEDGWEADGEMVREAYRLREDDDDFSQAGTLVREVAEKVGGVDGVRTSHVKLTWSPPWTKDRMTDEAKLELGLL